MIVEINKKCGRCKGVKPLSAFHRAPAGVSGRHGWCRECMNDYMRARRQPKRERLPQGLKRCPKCHEVKALSMFGRNRGRSNGVRGYCAPCERPIAAAGARAWRKTARGKAVGSTNQKRAYQNGKVHARQFTRLAVYFGILKREPCEVCGSPAQAHHDDYSQPLGVRWLCRLHHAALHKEEKRA